VRQSRVWPAKGGPGLLPVASALGDCAFPMHGSAVPHPWDCSMKRNSVELKQAAGQQTQGFGLLACYRDDEVHREIAHDVRLRPR